MSAKKTPVFMKLQPDEDSAIGACGCILSNLDGCPEIRLCRIHAAASDALDTLREALVWCRTDLRHFEDSQPIEEHLRNRVKVLSAAIRRVTK